MFRLASDESWRSAVRFEEVTYAVGLKDLFTTTSSRLVNINTAPAEVLRMFPGIDENIAQAIITARNGPDQVQGTEDDGLASPAAALAACLGMPPGAAAQFARFFSVRSLIFEVKVDVTAGGMKRRYIGLLRKNSSSRRSDPEYVLGMIGRCGEDYFCYWHGHRRRVKPCSRPCCSTTSADR